MAEKTGISWCDSTFNAWWGCEEISPECDNCYAKKDAARYGYPNLWSGQYRTFGEKHWQEPLKWNLKAQKAGKRLRVFTNSMADVFDMKAPESAREKLFALIEFTPNLDWLILTKRPAQARAYLKLKYYAPVLKIPLNIWLGVSCGLQWTADAFIPLLLDTPARIRWISHEPALGPIDWLHSKWSADAFYDKKIHWIVSGGEGNGARPASIKWFEEAKAAAWLGGIPWYMKQMGSYWAKRHYGSNSGGFRLDAHGTDINEWPHDLRIQQFPEAA